MRQLKQGDQCKNLKTQGAKERKSSKDFRHGDPLFVMRLLMI